MISSSPTHWTPGLSATRSLFERRDCVIVASVSCIYGLGSPEAYYGMLLFLEKGQKIKRQDILRKLVEILYERNDTDFRRGTFRVTHRCPPSPITREAIGTAGAAALHAHMVELGWPALAIPAPAGGLGQLERHAGAHHDEVGAFGRREARCRSAQ